MSTLSRGQRRQMAAGEEGAGVANGHRERRLDALHQELVTRKARLAAPEWIDHINWGESTVHIVGSQNNVRNSPEFDRAELRPRAEEPLLAFRRR